MQGTLEAVVTRLASNRSISVTGAGRTDSGVHAAGQVAHLDLEIDPDDLLYKCNRMLPADLVVREVRAVDCAFHARFSATSRTYRYTIATRRDPFSARFAFLPPYELDVEQMRLAAAAFCRRCNYTTFSKNNPSTRNMVCDVRQCTIRDQEDGLLIEVEADRFLYGMVRLIVGRLVAVGRGASLPTSVESDLQLCDRSQASPAVPARGLSLFKVGYDR